MNISIVTTLDTRYQRKDGTCAIILRIGRDNRTLPIPTGYNVPKESWNEKKREVRSSYRGVDSVERLNNLIDNELKAARSVLQELQESSLLDTLSLMEIKHRILSRKSSGSFFDFAEEVFVDLAKAKKFGTRDAYKSAVQALENYHGSKKLDFKQMTFEYLKKFETDHYSKGNTANGLAAYMRAIRAIYNKGIKSGRVDEKYYPFKKYTIKTAPTEKRAIEWELLEKIILLDLKPEDPLFNARNYFVSSYMMYGMNFQDMAFLTAGHIVNGRINYRRSKTSKLYDIKVTPGLKEILDYYIDNNTDSNYIFPIVRRKEAEMISRDIKWARKRYNKKLKDIAGKCGIEQNLTSYVSRHSFATQALLKDVPVTAISAMLGHSSLKTTQIYLKSLPSNMLDAFNEVVVGR
ncbi:MAG: site-specific integrase [Bacteroidetes bacterium]|nr:site-specific integrase [Bacteroidota bacterium]